MSMQLCLVNNNPISTVLITPDGEPLFSIETPPKSHAVVDVLVPSVPRPKVPTSTTRIKRLERHHQTTGHAETEIGVIEYQGPAAGCKLHLSANNHALEIPPHHDTCRTITEDHQQSEEEPRDNSWEFTSSDSERYMWKLFAHTPVLLSSSNSITPLARYRRAKIGIVSRSRRAFLEIFPAGLAIIDLIVVTFVAFMKQRILIDSAEPASYDVPPPPKPPADPRVLTPEISHLSPFEPRHMYASFSRPPQ